MVHESAFISHSDDSKCLLIFENPGLKGTDSLILTLSTLVISGLCSTWVNHPVTVSFSRGSYPCRKREKPSHRPLFPEFWGPGQRQQAAQILSSPLLSPQYCPPSLPFLIPSLMSFSITQKKMCCGVMEFPEDNNKPSLSSTWPSLIEHCQNRFLTKVPAHFLCVIVMDKKERTVSSTICPWPFSQSLVPVRHHSPLTCD